MNKLYGRYGLPGYDLLRLATTRITALEVALRVERRRAFQAKPPAFQRVLRDVLQQHLSLLLLCPGHYHDFLAGNLFGLL